MEMIDLNKLKVQYKAAIKNCDILTKQLNDMKKEKHAIKNLISSLEEYNKVNHQRLKR